MICVVPENKDNGSFICNGLCGCIDHRKCIKFMVVNTCNVYCLVALKDYFSIVAKHADICSSVYQCTSLASLDGMFGWMYLIGSIFGFPILLRLTCSNFADVAFQFVIGMLIRCVQRHHQLVLLGRIWYPELPFCVFN